VNTKLRRMYRAVAIAYLKVLSCHLLEETEKSMRMVRITGLLGEIQMQNPPVRVKRITT